MVRLMSKTYSPNILKMNNKDLIDYCIRNEACNKAIECLTYTGYDLEAAWYKCDRGEWLGWLVDKIGIDPRTRVLCAALCANEVRHLMRDQRSIDAVDVALKYGRGNATDEELYDANDAAYLAAAHSDAIGAYSAANCAAYAANFAAAVLDADANATNTANAACSTINADSAADSDSSYTTLKTAEIFRANIDFENVLKLIK